MKVAHEILAWVVMIGTGAAGAWALAAHWLEPLRVEWLWRFTAVAWILLFVQVALGVALLSGLDGDPPELHTFYGFLGPITVGIIYSYRSQLEQYRYLLYGLGGLFVMGLAIRAYTLPATV